MAIAPGIFRQYDIRGVVGKDLTTDAVRVIGGAYAALLAERGVATSGPIVRSEPR
jgi:phosphomannomutase / phosphoglucomutase